MLCPEVWKFTTNKQNTSYQKGSYDTKAKNSLNKTIRNNFINGMVSISLPGCETIPEPVQELIKTAEYYLIKDLCLLEFVHPDFLEAFIKRGRLTGISLETGISNDFESQVFVTPEGKLNILICKDLYQIIGLEGRPVSESRERFEIIIDLKNNNFLEQPKLYNRIKNALSNPEIGEIDFQLTWKPSIDSNICPSSIAKYFNKNRGFRVEQHSIQVQSTRTNNLMIPNEVFSGVNIDSVTAHQIAEYFAFAMLDCDSICGKELNSYRPSFNLNFDGEQSDRKSVVLHCKGLMNSDFVVNLLETLLKSDDLKCVILNVNGEQLSAKGNTGNTFIVLNDKKYFFFKS